jgi:hypothetical protein
MVVLLLEDARQAADAQPAKAHHPRVSQEPDVWGCPAAIVELPEMVGGFVVAADWGGNERARQQVGKTGGSRQAQTGMVPDVPRLLVQVWRHADQPPHRCSLKRVG